MTGELYCNIFPDSNSLSRRAEIFLVNRDARETIQYVRSYRDRDLPICRYVEQVTNNRSAALYALKSYSLTQVRAQRAENGDREVRSLDGRRRQLWPPRQHQEACRV